MFFRRISKEQVKTAIIYGEIIEEKPNDTPFPSYLILDFVAGKPIHVVLSYNQNNKTCYVVTTYHPNPEIWLDNFSKRK
jgi:Domain of unknown function (DUF4258)